MDKELLIFSKKTLCISHSNKSVSIKISYDKACPEILLLNVCQETTVLFTSQSYRTMKIIINAYFIINIVFRTLTQRGFYFIDTKSGENNSSFPFMMFCI